MTSTVALGELMASDVGNLDPSKYPQEVFELWSIPAYDQGKPELAAGSQIGSAKKSVEAGDVLLSRIVPHIRRSCVVAPQNRHRQIASGEWIVFRGPRFYPQYLRHILISDGFHLQFMQTVAGVGGSLLRARPAAVRNIQVPLPPLAEQKRIAAILDATEALRTKRLTAVAKLDQLAQSIFIEMFGGSKSNTDTLTNIFDFCTGKLDSNAAVPEGTYPFFTCSRDDFRIDTFAFDCEALLLAGNNASGDYSVKHYSGKFNAYQRTYIITYKDNKNSYKYGKFALQEKLKELKKFSRGTSTKYLTMELFSRLRIPIPDLHNQMIFEARISAVDNLRQRYSSSLSSLDSLLNSLQRRAFNGEL